MNTVHAIHVWLDAPAAADMGLDDYYSVSEVDADGEEIRCIGGNELLQLAWIQGRQRADELTVECLEMADESGRVTDRYTPERASECIRHGSFGPIVWLADGTTRMATQDDLDRLPCGDDLTEEEESELED